MTSERPDFGVLLALAQVTFAEELRAHMADVGFAGFSTRTGYVLRVLTAERLSLRALADELGMTSQATLKIVEPMVQSGLVERTPSPTDRRLRLITVTARGQDALSAARSFHDGFEQDLADRVGVAAAGEVRRALATIAGRAPAAVPQAVRASATSR